ncbi:Uncharacterized protein AXF42_Ash020633 [Apostasia shenzhenica]|uniref:Lunapark zinc ribbon domain-containing protein n=1 Tax=Apostasia shenzhenica TaxID=1088818 RepID=A0A2H9ZY83_9ASPA|nr:Uncharacterized protein AXF42_Ash020633 [Apostasia shenzhenica]
MAEAGLDGPAKRDGEAAEAGPSPTRSQRKGVISRIWRWIFGLRNEDYEKKLQHLSKEETAVHTRMKRRAHSLKERCRNLIVFSLTFEEKFMPVLEASLVLVVDMASPMLELTAPSVPYPCLPHVLSTQPLPATCTVHPTLACHMHLGLRPVVAVAFAVIAIKSLDFAGSMKFFRTLPAILLPCLSYVVYSALKSISRMSGSIVEHTFLLSPGLFLHFSSVDRKDQKTLERLRAERKAKIDELKEITNYYTTQQLIQRYDLDPAAKAAAATVLASKLGADSGLKVHIGDESAEHTVTTTNNGIKQESSVLRNRKQPSAGGVTPPQVPDTFHNAVSNPRGFTAAAVPAAPGTLVVEHHRSSGASDGGWIAKIAALLVGEDPSQCYALICGNCHRHNGVFDPKNSQVLVGWRDWHPFFLKPILLHRWSILFESHLLKMFSTILLDRTALTKEEKQETEGMEMKGSLHRIQKCANDLFSMEDDLLDGEDDEVSRELIGSDLLLKSMFLYCDLNRVISVAAEERKKTITEVANKLFQHLEELYSAVRNRSISLTQLYYGEAATAMQEVMAALKLDYSSSSGIALTISSR